MRGDNTRVGVGAASTHCRLRCGLSLFLFSVRPIVLSLARSTMCSSTLLHAIAQLRCMNAKVLRCLHIGYASILDQAHRRPATRLSVR